MNSSPIKSEARPARLRVPSVGVLLVFACLLMARTALFIWWMARSGIRHVEALGGEVSVLENPVTGFVTNNFEMDAVLLSTDRDVKFAFFKGPHVDDETMAVLRRFPNLKAVQLRGTAVTNNALTQLGRISRLTNLSLSDSPGVTDAGIAELLGKLPKLGQLDIDNLPITGANLGKCTHLEFVNLENCPSLGPTALQELSRLPHLHELDLTKSHVTDSSIERMDVTPSLEVLSLWSTDITDASLKVIPNKCPNVRWLILNELTGITDEGVQKLTQLKNLERLEIYESSISEQTAKSLQTAMPRCKIIHESFEK